MGRADSVGRASTVGDCMVIDMVIELLIIVCHFNLPVSHAVSRILPFSEPIHTPTGSSLCSMTRHPLPPSPPPRRRRCL